jgi:hypothetical protein
MPATRRKLNTIHKPRVAAASPAKETSSDTRATAITGKTDVALATSVDAADNASKADHAEEVVEAAAAADGKEE